MTINRTAIPLVLLTLAAIPVALTAAIRGARLGYELSRPITGFLFDWADSIPMRVSTFAFIWDAGNHILLYALGTLLRTAISALGFLGPPYLISSFIISKWSDLAKERPASQIKDLQ